MNTQQIPQTVTCLGYVRVSTERQADEKLTSLADQEAAINALAAKLGTAVGRFFRDEGASGATVEHRPAFSALLEHCEQNPRPARAPGLVLFLNDSRFGRFPDPDQAASLRFRFRAAGWVVRFCESDDTEDISMRSLMRSVGSVQASDYRRNLQRNSRRGKRGTGMQGFWTTKAPYGYRRIVVYPEANARVLESGQMKSDNEKVKLTIHESEAANVLWTFEQYANGNESTYTLVDLLLVRVPQRKWSMGVITSMLKNPAYRGAVCGGRKVSKDPHEIREPDPYTVESAHPAIIPPELWYAVQDRLASFSNKPRKRRRFYLLSGLVTCEDCGSNYVGGGHPQAHSDGTLHPFYQDTGTGKRVCDKPQGCVTVSLLDNAFITELANTIAKPNVQQRIISAIDAMLEGGEVSAEESEASVRSAKKKAETRMQRLIAMVVDGTVTQKEAAPQLAALRLEVSNLEEQLHRAQFGGRRAKGSTAERDALVSAALDFPRMAREMEGPELRRLIEPWLEFATFNKRTRMLTMGVRTAPGGTWLPQPRSSQIDAIKAGTIVRRVKVRRAGAA